MSTQGIIRAQGGLPWQWFLFDNRRPSWRSSSTSSRPGRGNRTPFDLPEAEIELVSATTPRYSGMRFSHFFLVEWGNMWV